MGPASHIEAAQAVLGFDAEGRRLRGLHATLWFSSTKEAGMLSLNLRGMAKSGGQRDCLRRDLRRLEEHGLLTVHGSSKSGLNVSLIAAVCGLSQRPVGTHILASDKGQSHPVDRPLSEAAPAPDKGHTTGLSQGPRPLAEAALAPAEGQPRDASDSDSIYTSPDSYRVTTSSSSSSEGAGGFENNSQKNTEQNSEKNPGEFSALDLIEIFKVEHVRLTGDRYRVNQLDGPKAEAALSTLAAVGQSRAQRLARFKGAITKFLTASHPDEFTVKHGKLAWVLFNPQRLKRHLDLSRELSRTEGSAQSVHAGVSSDEPREPNPACASEFDTIEDWLACFEKVARPLVQMGDKYSMSMARSWWDAGCMEWEHLGECPFDLKGGDDV